MTVPGNVTVGWLLPDGRVAGRDSADRIVRLSGRAVPGDVVRATSGDDPRVDAIVVPSPDRRTPPCVWSARCGGCDLDAMRPEARRTALAAMVQQALSLASPPAVRWLLDSRRKRIRLGLRDGDVGYYEPRSHTLVPVAACIRAAEPLSDAIVTLRGWLQTHGGAGLDAVDLRTDGKRVVYAFTSVGSVPRAVRDAMPTLGDVALDGRTVCGDTRLMLPVAGAELRASAGSFTQVAMGMDDMLVAHVCDALSGATRVLDLYAGIGTFAVSIARSGLPVTAVELEGAAVEDLRFNARGLPIDVVAKPVERFDATRVAFDAVVLDPPRAGAPGVLPKLLIQRPTHLVYVACFAPSAARDLRPALSAGYKITDVTCFDLFPDTHHIETVITLRR